MRKLPLFAATALLAASSLGIAAAQQADPYVVLGAGAAFTVQDDFDVEVEGFGQVDGEIEYNTGYVVNGIAGLQFTPKLAFEGEIQYRNSEGEGFSFVLDDQEIEGASGGIGEQEMLAVFINGAYTVAAYEGLPITVKAGLGLSSPREENVDGGLAYQVGVGVRYENGLGLDVSYFGTEIESSLGNTDLELDYGAINVSLSYRFNVLQ